MARISTQGDTLQIELGEEEWYAPAIDKERLEFLYREMARKQALRRCAIFVSPDPVFPIYMPSGKTVRHIVYQVEFPAADKPFKVAALFSGTIHGETYTKASELERRKLVRRVRDHLNELANGVAGRYAIALDTGEVLEKGRV